MSTLSLSEVKAVVKELLKRYHAEYALLFGSYAVVTPHPILISTSLSWAEKTLCPVISSHWPRTCVK